MIDYFALLDQPRAPWLDLEKLKEVYHRKTLVQHPDTQTPPQNIVTPAAVFADLNEAYRVLRDPKLRVKHLLNLEGHGVGSRNQIIPQELYDLFPMIGALTQKNRQLLNEIQATSNPLSRALLKSRVLTAQNETDEMRRTIQNLTETATAQLQRINENWTKDPATQVPALSNLYSVFAYLNRWSTQLDEMIFQFSLH
jgi:curved DNA-binding protein CbpA